MNEHAVYKSVAGLSLGGFHYFKQIGSTSDAALAWAAEGAPDLSLVYAEEQTSGRGRGDRRWFSPRGTGLAFSLVLRPLPGEFLSVPLFAGLGALAVCEALEQRGLHPEIKWPNDVLLNRQKVCGILAESVWIGEKVDSIVLGIGVNVKPESVPPPEHLNYPATNLETVVGKRVNRASLLKNILQTLLSWRRQLTNVKFVQAWESKLAFRGEQVEIRSGGEILKRGELEGLDVDGSLRLNTQNGQTIRVQFGEVYLLRVV